MFRHIQRRSLIQLSLLMWLALFPLLAAPADARSVIDATGRTLQLPDRVGRVMPAGQPAAVLGAGENGRVAACAERGCKSLT